MLRGGGLHLLDVLLLDGRVGRRHGCGRVLLLLFLVLLLEQLLRRQADLLLVLRFARPDLLQAEVLRRVHDLGRRAGRRYHRGGGGFGGIPADCVGVGRVRRVCRRWRADRRTAAGIERASVNARLSLTGLECKPVRGEGRLVDCGVCGDGRGGRRRREQWPRVATHHLLHHAGHPRRDHVRHVAHLGRHHRVHSVGQVRRHHVRGHHQAL